VARGTDDAESDIDIVAINQRPLTPDEDNKIRNEIFDLSYHDTSSSVDGYVEDEWKSPVVSGSPVLLERAKRRPGIMKPNAEAYIRVRLEEADESINAARVLLDNAAFAVLLTASITRVSIVWNPCFGRRNFHRRNTGGICASLSAIDACRQTAREMARYYRDMLNSRMDSDYKSARFTKERGRGMVSGSSEIHGAH